MKEVIRCILNKMGFYTYMANERIFHFFHFVVMKKENNLYNKYFPNLFLCRDCWSVNEYKFQKKYCDFKHGFLAYCDNKRKDAFFYDLETRKEYRIIFNDILGLIKSEIVKTELLKSESETIEASNEPSSVESNEANAESKVVVINKENNEGVENATRN